MTPWGFLRGAAANQATVRSQAIGDKKYSVVTWKTPQKAPSGLAYTVIGYIDDRKMVDRVETWVDHMLIGDMHVEALHQALRFVGAAGAQAMSHAAPRQQLRVR